ncbi:hypothetical protein VN97_g3319 [Penicillium thymicola]|uniref:Uncharacterized protein n=1 Tax=Penicillium thymicola TaxID=293382 RepID=A0AAI9TMC2_PENTH|nr:hypothetical protein VN97_g3319 [Penicillium thymicola]
MNLTQTTRWNLGDPFDPKLTMSWYGSTNFNNDYTAGLILSLNLSDPRWTYKNLAFPQFATANLPKEGFINARIPALRNWLSCAQVPNNGNCTYDDSLGLACDRDSPCLSTTDAGAHFDMDYFLQYGVGTGDDQRPSDCPTDSLLYGKYTLGRNETAAEYHYIYCDATIEEVDVDTKLQLPSLSIDIDTRPRVVESSARKPFNTNAYSLPSFNDVGFSYLFNSDPKYNNAFLEALTQGVDGVPMDQLFIPEKLIERVKVVYGVVVAQLLNTGARETFNEPYNKTHFVEPATMVAPTYTGVYHDGRKYLVQNEISTRLLEAVLASMVVCALIALCMIQTKRVLPKSPTSIASVASFLYGSRMLSYVIPPGAEWYSDEELKKRGGV